MKSIELKQRDSAYREYVATGEMAYWQSIGPDAIWNAAWEAATNYESARCSMVCEDMMNHSGLECADAIRIKRAEACPPQIT